MSALLRGAIDAARGRIWITQFLIDVRGNEDRYGEVLSLLRQLSAARRRGVDVRVLLSPVYLSGDRPVEELPIEANAAAARLLAEARVPVRYYTATSRRAWLHAKPALIDDLVLVGNGNWTPNCFRLNSEMSVAVRGSELSEQWVGRFEYLWGNARIVRDGLELDMDTRYSVDSGRRSMVVPKRLMAGGARLLASLDYPADVDSEAVASLLAGQNYLRTVENLLQNATERVWLSMYGLRASTAERMHPLFDGLIAATDRGVDVRVLYDGDPRTIENAARDVEALAARGVPVRAWPMRSRLHTRALLVDSTAIVGSVAWTPASVFLTEELAIAIRDSNATSEIAERLDYSWELAGTPPREWSTSSCAWPEHLLQALDANAVSTLGDVLDRVIVPGVTAGVLTFLQRCAEWIVAHRLPPAVAWVTARRFRASDLPKVPRRSSLDLDDLLRPDTQPRTQLDLAPTGSYLAALRPLPLAGVPKRPRSAQ